MNFHAKDLDGAYEILNQLHMLSISDGSKIETRLKGVITNLKDHWKGNDAVKHINGLMNVCGGMHVIIDTINLAAHTVSEPIIKAQTIRNSNGGVGDVGMPIAYQEQEPLLFEKLDATSEYYVDPTGAPADFVDLCDICDSFKSFCNKFHDYKVELINNWVSGSNREKIVSDFEEFESSVATYTMQMESAKSDLEIATSNLKNI